MDVATIERRYLKVTKRYLLMTGIWPDQKRSIKFVLRFIIYCIAISSLISQLARVVCFFSSDVLIEQYPFLSAVTLSLIKQGNYIVNAPKLKTLLSRMYDDWATERSKEEFEIMLKYAERGALFMTFYLVHAYSCVFLFIQIPLLPRILDIILPLNASRGVLYIFPAYYFVEKNDYYYLITTHMAVMTVTVLFIYVACDTGYMYVVQHACGLLAVSGHRFKHVIHDAPFERRLDNAQLREKTYKKMCFSIEGHNHAIEYIRVIESSHFGYLFVGICMIVVCFSITLVKIVTMPLCMEFYKLIGYLVAQLMHLFYLTIQGQLMENSNDKLYSAIYEAPWYNTDTKTQKLYILALRRNLTPPKLTAGGLVHLNMKCFSEVIKACMSYYTMFKST